MKVFSFVLMQGVFLLTLTAQRGVDPEAIAARFPGQNAVVLEQRTEYVFDLVADTLSVQQHHLRRILLLSQHTLPFSSDNIYFNAFSSIENRQAYTLVPRSGSRRFDRVDVARFGESHDRESSIFYNDSRTIQFAYPSLQKGAITHLEYTLVYHDPRFIRQSFFQSWIPVLNTKVVVKVHRDVDIGFRIFNEDAVDLEFRQYSRGRYNYYEWEASDLPPHRYINTRHFGVRHHSPHISVYVKQVNHPDRQETYYGTVGDLYRFYMELMSEMSTDSTPEMETLVQQLTHGLSDIDKIKAIYYWVQQNIRYVAYVEGYKGFIPAPPAEVFNKRFGDCKGMSVLLQKMLELAGIPSYLAWVGTREIPYTYNQCPLPAVDNHMVVALDLNGQTLILDATYNYLDLGKYPYSLKGKEVLIGKNKSEYRLFTVPVSHYSQNTVFDSVTVSINSGTLTGSGLRIHQGFNKLELAYAMRGVPAADYGKKFTSLFEKGSNKFMVNAWETSNLFDHDVPASVQYQFTLEDYVMQMDDEIYVNLNLDRSYQTMRMDTTTRFAPVTNDFPFKETHITRLIIPEGYSVSHIPADQEFVYDDFRVSFQYTHNESYITLRKEIVFDFLKLREDKFVQWNNMISHLVRNYRLSTVLTRDKNTEPSP